VICQSDLVGEPSGMGIPEIIEILAKDVHRAEEGFTLMFCGEPVLATPRPS
jgi:hypothetical protein